MTHIVVEPPARAAEKEKFRKHEMFFCEIAATRTLVHAHGRVDVQHVDKKVGEFVGVDPRGRVVNVPAVVSVGGHKDRVRGRAAIRS